MPLIGCIPSFRSRKGGCMKDEAIHIIEEAVFDFSYVGANQARHCNSLLERIYAEEIFPEIAEAFDTILNQNIHLEIGTLKLDLGTITEEDIRSNLGRKIKAGLMDSLQKLIGQQILGSQIQYGESNISQSLMLNALGFFLRKGYLPAWSGNKLTLSIILDQLLEARPRELGELIVLVSRQSDEAKKRVAFGFDQDYFDSVVQVLVPGDADWIIGYRESFLTFQREANEIPTVKEDLEKSVNLFLLNFILKNTGPKFNRMTFSNYFLRQVASHYNLDFHAFVRRLLAILDRNEASSRLYLDFREVLIWIDEKNSTEVSHPQKNELYAVLEDIAVLENSYTRSSPDGMEEWLAENVMRIPHLLNEHRHLGKSWREKDWLELIRRYAGSYAGSLIKIISLYLDWSASVIKSPGGRDSLLSELFETVSKPTFSLPEAAGSLGKWYAAVVIRVYETVPDSIEISQMLLDWAGKAAISQASLIVYTVRKKAGKFSSPEVIPYYQRNGQRSSVSMSSENTGIKSKEVGYSKRRSLLLHYLREGFLDDRHSIVNKKDLRSVLQEVVVNRDPALASSLRKCPPSQLSVFLKRVSSLWADQGYGELITYLEGFFPQQLKPILAFRKSVESAIPYLDHRGTEQFNELVLSQFARALKGSKTGFSKVGPYFSPLLDRLLHRMYFHMDSVSQKNLIDGLAARYRFWTAQAFSLNMGSYQKSYHSLQRIFQLQSAAVAFPHVSLNRVINSRDLRLPQDFTALQADHKAMKTRSMVQALISVFDVPSLELLDRLGRKEDETLQILKQELIAKLRMDLNWLSVEIRRGVWSNEGKILRQVRLMRIVELTKATPSLMEMFLKRHKHFAPILLKYLYDNLPVRLWRGFARTLFPEKEKYLVGLEVYFDQNQPVKVSSKNLEGWLLREKALVSPWAYFSLIQKLSTDFWGDPVKSIQLLGRMEGGTGSSIRESSYLVGIEQHWFASRTSMRIWKRSVVLSRAMEAISLGSGASYSHSSQQWVYFFCQQLTLHKTLFHPDRFRWDLMMESKELSIRTRSELKKMLKKTYPAAGGEAGYAERAIQLSRALAYVSGYGFMPWWSPAKSKSFLLVSFFSIVENSPKMDAVLLVKGFSVLNFSNLLKGVPKGRLKELLAYLQKSVFVDKYADFMALVIAEVMSKEPASEPGNRSGERQAEKIGLTRTNASQKTEKAADSERPEGVRSGGIKEAFGKAITWGTMAKEPHLYGKAGNQTSQFSGTRVAAELIYEGAPAISASKNGLPYSVKDGHGQWVFELFRKEVHHSREQVIVQRYFGQDSRIEKQVQELLSLSGLMYFGSLNPGKWRLLVLGFSYGFYILGRRTYTPLFAEEFFKHLLTRQGIYPWKRVMDSILGRSEVGKQVPSHLVDTLRKVFPQQTLGIQPEKLDVGDSVNISNAGLILCWPFLTMLFSRLKLSQGMEIPAENKPKAVYLLQYLVYGRTDFPEYEMVLNKLMVGMRPDQHLGNTVDLTEEEKDLTISLIHGMKQNWEKMKNASIEAVRETFLQRNGILEFNAASTVLRVPKTGVDVLLDSVSWNIAVVKLPWMEKTLEVKWR